MAKNTRGSLHRCLMLTGQARERVASDLTDIVQPFATVSPSDVWMPCGPDAPREAKLGEVEAFLSAEHREVITSWWLARRRRANTPNWDIVSTCTIGGQPGLVLVEAKAHDHELSDKGKRPGNPENDARIAAAIGEADAGLNGVLPGWSLTKDSHYQLANRFAWSWKLAALGVPVVLVYLGFLDAQDMSDQGQAFPNHDSWERCLLDHSRDVMPHEAWDTTTLIAGTPLVPLIRSAIITTSG